MKATPRRLALALLPLALLAAAVLSLRDELGGLHLRQVAAGLEQLPARAVALAALLTAVDYLLLSGYDLLALRYVGRALPYPRVLLTSFVAYAFGNNVGFALLSSGAVRLRLYSQWGLSAAEVGRVIAFTAAQLWVGLLPLAGVALLAGARVPLPRGAALGLGVAALAVTAAYLALAARGAAAAVRGVELRAPSLPLALGQVVVSALDWAAAAGVLHVLLPAGADLSYPALLGLFVAAQIAGLASQLPGGVGVFEAVVLSSLVPGVAAGPVLASLVAFRLVYYLAPFGVAFAVLAVHELLAHRRHVGRFLRGVHSSFAPVVPWAAAGAAVLAGTVLLLSGATPSVAERVALLRRLLPLPVVEASHLVGSLTGTALLLVAHGLARRLSGAWALALALLGAGAAASLAKGLDWEEAVLLAGVAAGLVPFRGQFYRRSALLAEPAAPGWLALVATILAGVTAVGFLAYRHVEYASELWFEFAFHADAPRFLRASVVGGGGLALLALARLLRPAPPEPGLPGEAELARLRALARASPDAQAHLALVGDKAVLFSPAGDAFLMYGVEGRSWISMGDPVGPQAAATELAWELRGLADRHGGWACFYQVAPAHLPRYLDLGLGLYRLGEEALVPLTGFSLDGPARRPIRLAYHRAERDGLGFEVVPAEAVPALVPGLRAISDAWLAARGVREKGFSLGFFDPRYLAEGPVAVVRRTGRPIAFANVWAGECREELSIDLMRHAEDVPGSTMDFLFTSLLLWGKAQGYRTFNLGMAPFSGFEERALAPLWTRVGATLYRRGEPFYNFQGLRRFKEKFCPEWRPRYLAAPGGLRLPRVLANVAALVSRGLVGAVTR